MSRSYNASSDFKKMLLVAAKKGDVGEMENLQHYLNFDTESESEKEQKKKDFAKELLIAALASGKEKAVEKAKEIIANKQLIIDWKDIKTSKLLEDAIDKFNTLSPFSKLIKDNLFGVQSFLDPLSTIHFFQAMGKARYFDTEVQQKRTDELLKYKLATLSYSEDSIKKIVEFIKKINPNNIDMDAFVASLSLIPMRERKNINDFVLYAVCGTKNNSNLIERGIEEKLFPITARDTLGHNFWYYALIGPRQHLDFLKEIGCPVERINPNFYDLLYIAVLTNDINKVKFVYDVLGINMRPNQYLYQNERNYNPLLLAALLGNKDIFDFLSNDPRAEIFNISDRYGLNIIHYVFLSNKPEFINHAIEVLKKKAEALKIDFKEFINKPSTMKPGTFFLNTPETWHDPRLDQCCPLHLVSFMGDKGTFELLLKNGADVGCLDGHGRNILHYAAMGGNQEIFAYLSTQYPELVNSKDKYGKLPNELVCFSITRGGPVSPHITPFDYTNISTFPRTFDLYWQRMEKVRTKNADRLELKNKNHEEEKENRVKSNSSSSFSSSKAGADKRKRDDNNNQDNEENRTTPRK